MITKDQIEQLANKFQIDTYTILREYLQLVLLKKIYEQKKSEQFYFKGGTSIHLLYRSFRFSEDLDFTATLSIKEIEEFITTLKTRLLSEIPGFTIADRLSKDFGITKIGKYDYGKKYPLTIKIDISIREKPLTKNVSPIETLFPVSPYPLVVHMDAEELLAEKIRALLSREKGRDLFDLWFLLSQQININKKFLEKKLEWYKLTLNFNELTKKIETFSQKNLENDLGKFLPKNYRPFLKDLKVKAREKISLLISKSEE